MEKAMGAWIKVDMKFRLETGASMPEIGVQERMDRIRDFFRTCEGDIACDEHHILDTLDALEQLCNIIRRARVSGKVAED
jgi:hypothetical protein